MYDFLVVLEIHGFSGLIPLTWLCYCHHSSNECSVVSVIVYARSIHFFWSEWIPICLIWNIKGYNHQKFENEEITSLFIRMTHLELVQRILKH